MSETTTTQPAASAPAPVAPAPGPAATVPASPKTFTAEYVTELREEAAAWRHRHKEAATTAEQAAQEAARAKAEAAEAKRLADEAAAARIAEVASAADQRVIRAELKAAAMRAGMLDLDGLKLLDTSVVTLNGDGEVVIPEDFFEKAKAAKPYLFGAPRSDTSSTAVAPPASTGGPKDARKMTPAELTEFEKKHGLNPRWGRS